MSLILCEGRCLGIPTAPTAVGTPTSFNDMKQPLRCIIIMEIIANPVRFDDGYAQVKCDSERELQRSNPSPLNTTVLTHELTGGLLVSSLFHPKLVVGWLLLGTFMYFVQMEGIHLPSLGSVESVTRPDSVRS